MLRELPHSQAKAIVLALAAGTAMAIKAKRITFKEGEDIVFNTDTYFLCKDTLKDPALAEIISAGIQLEDALEVFGESELMKACEDLLETLQTSEVIPVATPLRPSVRKD